MHRFLAILIGALFVLTGYAFAEESASEEAKTDEQKLKELMYDPDEAKLETIMKEAAAKEDWLGAIPKIEKLISDGVGKGEFAEDSILCEEMKREKFHCLILGGKLDEAKKFAENISSVKEEIEKGKEYYSEANVTVLEAGLLGKYGFVKKSEEKLDKFLKKSGISKEDKQKVLFCKAIVNYRANNDYEKFLKLLEETQAADPESKIGQLVSMQITAVKQIIEQQKEAEKEAKKEEKENK